MDTQSRQMLTRNEAAVSEEVMRGERAYHEAGHAIAAHRLGEQVEGLTIEADGTFDTTLFSAVTHIRMDENAFLADPLPHLERAAIWGLAGAIAGSYVGRQTPIDQQPGNPLNHVETAGLFARILSAEDGRDSAAMLASFLEQAHGLLNDDPGWNALISIGNTLAERGRLSRDEFLLLMEEHSLLDSATNRA